MPLAANFITRMSIAVCAALVLWAVVLGYLTFRVCRESGGTLTDSVYSCALASGEVSPWFQLLHPITILLSLAVACISIGVLARWFWPKGGW